VIGVLGPTNRTASVSPDVNDPGFRNIHFENCAAPIAKPPNGLIDGGADTDSGRDHLRYLERQGRAVRGDEVFAARGARLPVMISGTITDERPHAHRPDRRSVLELGAPCEPLPSA
jgi:5-methyltetrahydrofolate--homocysteine methyltransferase